MTLNAYYQADFQKQAYDLLQPEQPGGKTFDEKTAALRKAFPKANRWLQWWEASDVKAMLFKSRNKRIDDDGLDDDVMPATTNAQESLHRVYYMIS